MRVWSGKLRSSFDVVIVGSGAPALTAALAAQLGGARVLLVEKSDVFGGTSAVSGGMLWVPLNKYMKRFGVADSREDALRYLEQVSGGRTSDQLLAAVVDSGPEMLAFLEASTALSFVALESFPDYHPEWAGARGEGRSLEPEPLHTGDATSLIDGVRFDGTLPITMREYQEWRAVRRFDWDSLRARAGAGLVSRGRALIAGLIMSCADAGVTLVTGVAAKRLVQDAGRVVGLSTESGEQYEATTAVVLGCGGFEWSSEMTANFLRGPVQVACSPPHNTGDGIRMAAKIGAKLGNLNEAWWAPMMQVPGNSIDGSPTASILRFERTGPRTMIVNRSGQRFVNEAHNYNDMAKALHAFDPATHSYANLPAHLLFDQAHIDEYGFMGGDPGDVPAWLTPHWTFEELAASSDIDPDGLARTVSTFNECAVSGHDPLFGRGESSYDRYWGDQTAPHPNLGPLDTPPFYSVPVFAGALGTKGGIVTDEYARALDTFDEPIEGLYAVGNTTAHPMGSGYPGAGGTLGPGMTMGYVAGRHCATLRAEASSSLAIHS